MRQKFKVEKLRAITVAREKWWVRARVNPQDAGIRPKFYVFYQAIHVLYRQLGC
jgi:hypothetical protein